MTCQSGSGQWRFVGDNPVLDGALCAIDGQNDDLYRFDFHAQHRFFAPTVPNTSGKLRYLHATAKVLFYADDIAVYALDRDHLKVIWSRPWAHAQLLPLDPFDPMHIAITSGNDDDVALHLVRIGVTLDVEMSTPLDTPPVDVIWQNKRLVVIERNQFTYWPRPGIALPPPPDNHRATPETPSTWKRPPQIVSLDPPLQDGDYKLDDNGFLFFKRNLKKLSYFRFSDDSWTTARLNSSSSVQGIGGADDQAAALIQDYHTIRIFSRLGVYLKKRIEVKYWKLPNPLDKNIFLAQTGIAAVDGGANDRILTLDTSDYTWKRLAIIDLPSPGSMTELQNGILYTLHRDGENALIRWNAKTGNQIDAISSQKLQNIDFGPIQRTVSIGEFQRYILLVNAHEQFVLYDFVTGELSSIYPFERVPWSKLPKLLAFIDSGFVIQSPNSAIWDFFPATSQGKRMRFDASTCTQTDEIQTPQEKWYGYCLDVENCFIPTANPPEQRRAVPQVPVESGQQSHAPSIAAWLLTLFSLLSIFGVTLWRHGFGRKSQLQTRNENDEVSTTDLFDAHNRRYISNRDYQMFLAPNRFATPHFRLILSATLGLGLGVLVAIPYFYDDVFSTFLSWVIVLGMPVSAITWIATSWTFWNRYYLLRFGAITEGKWLHNAQTNPSILYEPKLGLTFELNRRQWQRIDFVPMVLFDPAHPEFAVQYTGGCSHTVMPHGDIDAKPHPARSYDITRLCLVCAVLVGVIVGTQNLHHAAFPNPLSAWKMRLIEPENDQTFTTACLAQCQTDDVLCQSQCHRRQLRLVLEKAGIPLENDPKITAAQFLQTQLDVLEKSRQIILDSKDSCDNRLSAIQNLAFWPDALSTAFWETYRHPATFELNGLAPIDAKIRKDVDLLRALCDEYGACAQIGASCPAPPACPGRISELKPAVCALQNAADHSL